MIEGHDQDLHRMFEEEADAPVEQEGLAKLTALGDRLSAAYARLERLEAQVEDVKTVIDQLETTDIPEVMRELGMAGGSFKLQDGSTIAVEEKVYAYISERNREAAHRWLQDNGHGDLIKGEFKVAFGRGEHDKLLEITGICAERGVAAVHKEQVHPQTLGAFVREQLKAGKDLPEDILGIRRVSRVKVEK